MHSPRLRLPKELKWVTCVICMARASRVNASIPLVGPLTVISQFFCASGSHETNFKTKIAPYVVYNKSFLKSKIVIFPFLDHTVIFCIFSP